MRRILIPIATIFILGTILTGCGHTHEWEPATCDSPKTCKSCGETEGTILDHEWVEATCQEAKHCARCALSEGVALEHEWVEATCQEAKHCVNCGTVQGDVAEHIWSEATCTEAKTCTVCNKTDGEPLGHKINEWTTAKEATCSEEGKRVGTCERCLKECEESIEKLPHTPGDWQVITDYIFNPDGTVKAGTEAIICTICSEELETREYAVELTLSQKNAVICAYDELSFWHCGPDFLIYTILVDFNKYPVTDAKFAIAHMDIDWDEQAVLYARENCEGASKAGLSQDMRYYGFSNSQIENALREIGY